MQTEKIGHTITHRIYKDNLLDGVTIDIIEHEDENRNVMGRIVHIPAYNELRISYFEGGHYKGESVIENFRNQDESSLIKR